MGYGKFAAALLAGFIVLCGVVRIFLYRFGKSKTSTERRPEEDDMYALRKIGKDSVYSYIVTDKPLGWLAAFITLGIQFGILVLFILASEAKKLHDDNIDVEFTWKCPRDSDVCKDKTNLNEAGWFIFSLLMTAFLAKDMINGSKLIYHSSKVRHTLWSRIRYFVGGVGLCSITLFAFYVSTVYNRAIATSNTAIIVNSVIVLFVMEIDEYIFAAFNAINDKWTEHAAESEEASKMEEELERQRAQNASQQEQIDEQRKDLRMLREIVVKMQEPQARAGATLSTSFSQCTDHESMTTHESNDDDTDIDAEKGGTTDEIEDSKAALPLDVVAPEIEKGQINAWHLQWEKLTRMDQRSSSQSRRIDHESITTHESKDNDTDKDAEKEGTSDEMEDDKAALPLDAVVLEIEKEKMIASQQPSPVAAASCDSECESDAKAEV